MAKTENYWRFESAIPVMSSLRFGIGLFLLLIFMLEGQARPDAPSTAPSSENVKGALALLEGTALYFNCMIQCFNDSINLDVPNTVSCTGKQELKEMRHIIEKADPSEDDITDLVECLTQRCRLLITAGQCYSSQDGSTNSSKIFNKTITIVPQCSDYATTEESPTVSDTTYSKDYGTTSALNATSVLDETDEPRTVGASTTDGEFTATHTHPTTHVLSTTDANTITSISNLTPRPSTTGTTSPLTTTFEHSTENDLIATTETYNTITTDITTGIPSTTDMTHASTDSEKSSATSTPCIDNTPSTSVTHVTTAMFLTTDASPATNTSELNDTTMHITSGPATTTGTHRTSATLTTVSTIATSDSITTATNIMTNTAPVTTDDSILTSTTTSTAMSTMNELLTTDTPSEDLTFTMADEDGTTFGPNTIETLDAAVTTDAPSSEEPITHTDVPHITSTSNVMDAITTSSTPNATRSQAAARGPFYPSNRFRLRNQWNNYNRGLRFIGLKGIPGIYLPVWRGNPGSARGFQFKNFEKQPENFPGQSTDHSFDFQTTSVTMPTPLPNKSDF